MDHRSKLVAAFLALCSLGAQAYVSPSPPPGFGGSPGAWTFTPPSPAQQLGGIIRGPGPSIAGGATRAAYQLGGGAARALARGVVLGGVPGVLLMGGLWLAQNCFEKQGAQWVRTCGGGTPPVSDGWEYRTSEAGQFGVWYPDPNTACTSRFEAWKAATNFPYTASSVFASPGGGDCRAALNPPASNQNYAWNPLNRRARADCPAGWYITPAGCVVEPPPIYVTPQEVEDGMAGKPLPSELPGGMPYPIELPIWNPTITDPAVGQPLRVPQGNPRVVPNTNPQQYSQPTTRYTHSPTQGDPWRMDVTPEDVPTDSTGLPGPTSVTSGGPPPTTEKEPDPPDLCEKNPDIVACQKLGTLEPTPLANSEVPLAINPEGGFPSAGSCPAPKTQVLMGKTFSFSLQPLCDFATGIKPILIAFAWLSAAMVFMGIARREN